MSDTTKWTWGAALAGMAVVGLFLAAGTADPGMYLHGLLFFGFGAIGV